MRVTVCNPIEIGNANHLYLYLIAGAFDFDRLFGGFRLFGPLLFVGACRNWVERSRIVWICVCASV